MGGRLVKRGILLSVLVVTVVGIAFVWSLQSTFENADWTGKPDASELKLANAQLELPSSTKGDSLSVFSKTTFVGASREVVVRGSTVEWEGHLASIAARHGWTLTSRREKNNELRLAYCAGNVSQIVSLRPKGSEVAIFAGTYWDSDKSTDLYCRES